MEDRTEQIAQSCAARARRGKQARVTRPWVARGLKVDYAGRVVHATKSAALIACSRGPRIARQVDVARLGRARGVRAKIARSRVLARRARAPFQGAGCPLDLGGP